MSINSATQTRVVTAVSYAGVLIRYSFYLVGALVIGAIGIAMLSFYNGRTRMVDDRPSYRIAAQHLAKLSVKSQVVTGGRFGRLEMLQYGALHDRDMNLNIVLGIPPRNAVMTRDTMPRLRDVTPLRDVRTMFSQSHYDVETRFGAWRATDLRVDSDGQWKQCLAFVSRFDTAAMYLMGWYCDASGAMPSASTLACILDKLTLDATVASAEADTYLRQRAGRPASCSAVPVAQTVDTRPRRSPQNPARWSTPNAKQRRW